jgi:hypothetical protein
MHTGPPPLGGCGVQPHRGRAGVPSLPGHPRSARVGLAEPDVRAPAGSSAHTRKPPDRARESGRPFSPRGRPSTGPAGAASRRAGVGPQASGSRVWQDVCGIGFGDPTTGRRCACAEAVRWPEPQRARGCALGSGRDPRHHDALHEQRGVGWVARGLHQLPPARRVTSQERSSAPCGAATPASAPSSRQSEGDAPNARSWSSTTSNPTPDRDRPLSRTSHCAAGATTSTKLNRFSVREVKTPRPRP